jgi:hypothetical protein
MKLRKAQQRALQRVLQAIYHRKDHVDLGARWPMHVMHQIRSIGPLQTTTNTWVLFAHCVWRFAVVVCVIAFILSIYVLQTGFSPEYEVAQLFTDDPVEFMLVQVSER